MNCCSQQLQSAQALDTGALLTPLVLLAQAVVATAAARACSRKVAAAALATAALAAWAVAATLGLAAIPQGAQQGVESLVSLAVPAPQGTPSLGLCSNLALPEAALE